MNFKSIQAKSFWTSTIPYFSPKSFFLSRSECQISPLKSVGLSDFIYLVSINKALKYAWAQFICPNALPFLYFIQSAFYSTRACMLPPKTSSVVHRYSHVLQQNISYNAFIIIISFSCYKLF